MTMTFIASAALNGSNVVRFSNIPQTFTHLQLRTFLRSSVAGVQDFIYIRPNDEAGNNCVAHTLIGDGSSTAATFYNARTYSWLTDIPGAGATSGIFGNTVIDILDYTNTNKFKTIRAVGGYDRNGAGTVGLASGLWMSTSAITTLKVDSANANSVVGSRVDLYGITTSTATGA